LLKHLICVEENHIEVAIKRLDLPIAMTTYAVDAPNAHADARAALETRAQHRERPRPRLTPPFLSGVVRQHTNESSAAFWRGSSFLRQSRSSFRSRLWLWCARRGVVG
jgi:hypothetical protein